MQSSLLAVNRLESNFRHFLGSRIASCQSVAVDERTW